MSEQQTAPFVCPVCYGTGQVANGFYTRVGVPDWSSASNIPERCQSCMGSGIVWSKPTLIEEEPSDE